MQQKLNQNRSAVRINPKLQSRSALTVTSEAPATRRGRNKLMGPQLQLSKTDAPRRQRQNGRGQVRPGGRGRPRPLPLPPPLSLGCTAGRKRGTR